MRHRRVFCQGFDGRDVGESDCPSAERPASSDICDMGSCSANTWFFTEWSGQVMNYTFGLYFVFIPYFFVFFFLVFGRMRNWYPNAQGSLFLEQWNWLRRYQEARNIQDVRFGQRLQRQMVRRSLESGIKLILIINCVEHNRTNEKKTRIYLYSVQPRVMKDRRLVRSSVWLSWEASTVSDWICSAQRAISQTTRRRVTWASACHNGTRPTGPRCVFELVICHHFATDLENNCRNWILYLFELISVRLPAERGLNVAKPNASTRTRCHRKTAERKTGPSLDLPAISELVTKVFILFE